MNLSTIIVEVSGKMQGGARFCHPIKLEFDSNTHTPEQALIKHYGQNCQTFEELAASKRWTDAYWTYPHVGKIKVKRPDEEPVEQVG